MSKLYQKKHIVLVKIQPLLVNRWAEEINNTNVDSALLFIHGFNVTFEDASRRMAQLKWDLDFNGPAILYSWPSKGSIPGYATDEETIRLTEENLITVFETLSTNTNIKNIDIIAHSMGCRAIVEVLTRLSLKYNDISINQVILAAPDINTDLFHKDIAPKISGVASRISLYASSNDKALIASKKAHTYNRLGETGENIYVMSGIDTIDASLVDTSFLGHGYFADSKTVIDDIHHLLKNNLPPEKRNLRKKYFLKFPYWIFP